LIGFGAVKIVFERTSGDLVYTTTLTPGRIVWGKVQLGLVVSLLFGSMTLPFLTIVWLGRGVGILETLFTFLFVFALTQMHYASTLAMFAGATSFTAVFARLLPWLIGQMLLFFCGLVATIELLQQASPEDIFVMIFVFTVLCSIAHLLATAQFAPETANRMFPVRVGLTILFSAVMTAVLVVICVADNVNFPGWLGTLLEFLLLTLWLLVPYLFLVFICERTELSNRQRQRIPVSFIGRLIVFPFYSGVAHAMVWSAGLVWFGILCLGIITCCANSTDGLYGRFVFALVFFDYCATSLLICNLLLRKWLSRHWYWVPVCTLIGTIIAVSFVVEWFPPYNEQWWEFFEAYPLLPQPWETYDEGQAYFQYVFGEIWLVALCIVGLPWVVRAFRKFRRDTPTEPVTESEA